MRVWWLSHFNRLDRERRVIEEVIESQSWLLDATWVLEGVDLCVDAVIQATGVNYQVRLRYPSFFPTIPPAVLPQDREEPRWSGHQYGSGGELCLEWGPDNWNPEVTGAEVLQSAHRLLTEENPLGEGERVEVPSRHQTTLGQDLRVELYRLIVTEAALSRLKTLKGGDEVELRVFVHRASLLAFVHKLDNGVDTWADPNLPNPLAIEGWLWKAVVVPAATSVSTHKTQSLTELRGIIADSGLDPSRLDAVDETGRRRIEGALFVDRSGGSMFVRVSDRSNDKVVPSRTIVVMAGPSEDRLGLGESELESRQVGVVGLGSAGSKIALMLARSGVRNFVLVDDDLLLPENLVRHTLDWRSVGEHKVDGVARQLELVAPNVEVQVHRRRLTGQEPTSSVASILKELSCCALIIDATACSRTFGFLGSAASHSRTPLVWLEVFGGGIGGLVGRYRPRKDPDPFMIRARLTAYLAELDAPELEPAGPYTAAGPQTEPLVASDADISVVAAHATRLALDILVDKEPSSFPHSVYLLGLERAWIFDAPFSTIAVDVGEPEARRDEAGKGAAAPTPEAVEFIEGVLKRSLDGGGDSCSARGSEAASSRS